MKPDVPTARDDLSISRAVKKALRGQPLKAVVGSKVKVIRRGSDETVWTGVVSAVNPKSGEFSVTRDGGDPKRRHRFSRFGSPPSEAPVSWLLQDAE